MRTTGAVGGIRSGGLAVMAAATILAAGCSSGGSGDGGSGGGGSGGGTADTTSATAASGSGSQASTATTAASGTGSAATPGDPIGSTAGYGIDGDSGADVPVTLDVLSLERASNDTVLLRFAVTNDSPTLNLPVGNAMGAGVLQDDVSGVSLVDLSQNLRYLVLVDADGECLCTETETDAELVPGQRREFEARFPAPPASTATMDVQISPFGTVHDVALAGGGNA